MPSSHEEFLTCPSCGDVRGTDFTVVTQESGSGRKLTARRCASCGLVYLHGFRDDRSSVYGPGYAAWGEGVGDDRAIADSKRISFRRQLRALVHATGSRRGRLLDVGTGMGYLLDAAAELGFEPYGIDVSKYAVGRAGERHPGRVLLGSLDDARLPDGHFDAVTMTDLVEHVADPTRLFREALRVLGPGGLLFVITPDTDSWSRRLMGQGWMQYKFEHVIYWNRRSLTRALEAAGFEVLTKRHNWKTFSPAYYAAYFKKYALLGGFGRLLVRLCGWLPLSIQRLPFPNPVTGEMLVVARKRG